MNKNTFYGPVAKKYKKYHCLRTDVTHQEYFTDVIKGNWPINKMFPHF